VSETKTGEQSETWIRAPFHARVFSAAAYPVRGGDGSDVGSQARSARTVGPCGNIDGLVAI
jgi:hypothetical protein